MCTGGRVSVRVRRRVHSRVLSRVLSRVERCRRTIVRVTRRLLLHMRHLAQHDPTQRRREQRDRGEDRSKTTETEEHARGSGEE